MGNTSRHILFGCLWFHGFLIAAGGLFRSGALSSKTLPFELIFGIWAPTR